MAYNIKDIMGMSINYSGKLKSVAFIQDLVDEVIEIAKVNEWLYEVVDLSDDEDSQPLKGILFGHPDNDPISMLFDLNGVVLAPFASTFDDQELEDFISKSSYHSLINTLPMGADYHIQVVNLLKYISDKYFDEWKVMDESKYWETGDRDYLEDTIKMISNTLEALNDAFDVHADTLADKTPEEIKDFIGRVLGKDLSDIKIISIDEEQ